MDSSATTNASSTFPIPEHYTNYVNVHLSIDKLDGKNYDTWASDIRLWLKSQGYVDHLTTSVANVPENEVSRWLKIDAQLCMVLKSTIHSSLKQIFALMRRVQKFGSMPNYYIPMILNVFMEYVKISFMLLLRNVLMVQCLSILIKFILFFHDYNELLPSASTPFQEIEQ